MKKAACQYSPRISANGGRVHTLIQKALQNCTPEFVKIAIRSSRAYKVRHGYASARRRMVSTVCLKEWKVVSGPHLW